MSDKRKLILIILALIVSVGLFSLYIIFFLIDRPEPEVASKPGGGVAAQDFGLPDLRGEYVKLSGQRGKVVFLNMWATWCPPCREEMPSMEALYQKLKGRPFEMLAVSIDRDGGNVVRPFVAKYRLTFPVLLDPEGKTYRLYGLTGVPETFIIDKKGIVIHKIIGPQNWTNREWLDYFDRILRDQ
jgi:peroxiredoxin